ncbi:hypothetical protein BZA70DRAFT_293226 [Myxozyma melibiosi]|uniref:F-box domain-containing protein n=1 Tax=Myxozyma melibiosi TaxID=54550 RepID=A0ABR1FDJ0_9ASCO
MEEEPMQRDDQARISDFAMDVDTETPVQASASLSSALPPDKSVHDPAQYLYQENFTAIMRYLDTFEIAQMESVSRLWRDYIKNTPELWRRLDLRRAKEPVPFSFVEMMVKRAGDALAEVYLHNLSVDGTRKSLELILRCADYKDEDEMREFTIFQSRLRKLFVEGYTKILELPSDAYSPTTWSVFDGLREVQFTLDDMSSFMSLFLEGKFPNITHLTFYSGQSNTSVDQRVTYKLDFLLPASNQDFKTFPRVKSLCLGGRSIMSPPERARYADIGARTVQRLVWLFPGLTTFTMTNIVLARNRDLNFETLDPPNTFRLDFRGCSKLKEFNISGSTLSALSTFPILPSSVEKLAVNKCSGGAVPRTVMIENGVPQYVHRVETEWMPVIVDEYKNLSEIDLGGVGISGAELVDFLWRCDPNKVHTLSIDYCYDLKFQTKDRYRRSDTSTFALLAGSHYVRSRFAQERWDKQLLITMIVDLVPHLKRLRIGLNINVDDVTIRELAQLRELEYLDLSGTLVNTESLLLLIASTTADSRIVRSRLKEAYTRRKRYERELRRRRLKMPESRIPEFVPWEVMGRMSPLKTLVLNNCDELRKADELEMISRIFNINVKCNGKWYKADMVQPEAEATRRLRGYFERHMSNLLHDHTFTLEGNEMLVEEEWREFREGGHVIAQDDLAVVEDDYEYLASFRF